MNAEIAKECVRIIDMLIGYRILGPKYDLEAGLMTAKLEALLITTEPS